MWPLKELFGQTIGLLKAYGYDTQIVSTGFWKVKGHCLSLVSAEDPGREEFISKKYVDVIFV